MTDSKIKEKILQDAKADAQKILQEAKQKADEIMRQSKKKVETIKTETDALARETKDKEVERRLSAARMDSRRAILQEKRTIIDSVFGEAKNRLLNLKKQEYVRFISGIIKEEVRMSGASLVLAKNDIKKFGDAVGNEILKASGMKGTVPIEKGDFDGGCIVKRENYEFNATLDTILARIKEQLESELQKTLFS